MRPVVPIVVGKIGIRYDIIINPINVNDLKSKQDFLSINPTMEISNSSLNNSVLYFLHHSPTPPPSHNILESLPLHSLSSPLYNILYLLWNLLTPNQNKSLTKGGLIALAGLKLRVKERTCLLITLVLFKAIKKHFLIIRTRPRCGLLLLLLVHQRRCDLLLLLRGGITTTE